MNSLTNKMPLNETKKRLTFKKHKAGKNGYSEWIYPKKDETYLMRCCDCGLIHEIEFGTFIEGNRKRNKFKVIKLPEEVRVMFRARRFKDLIMEFTKK